MTPFSRGFAIGLASGTRPLLSINASSATFLTTTSNNAIVANLSDPFGSGSTFSTFGTVPGQLKVSGSTLQGTGTASFADQSYTIGVLAISADGTRAVGNQLTLTAVAGASVTLGTLSLSAALTNGTSSSGSITGATAGSTIVSNVTGLTVNSSARTYTFSGAASAGNVANGLVETLAGATNSPKNNAVTVASAAATVANAPAFTLSAAAAQVTIAWTDGSNGGSAITGHKLYRSTTTGFTPGPANLVGTISTASPYIDGGLINGTAYFYRLSAVNGVGESTVAAEKTATPIAAPAAPTITATAGTGKVTIGFTDGAANGSAIIERRVYRSTSTGFIPAAGNLLSTSPTFPFDDTTGVAGTTYYYKAINKNAVGDSSVSNEAVGTPNPASVPFAIAANTNAIGDSQVIGVGAPTGFDWPTQLKALETSNSGNIINSTGLTTGGGNTASMLANFSGTTAARRAGNFIFAHGLSDIIYAQTYADGPATIKSGIASMIGNSDFVNGGGWWYYAVQPSPDGGTKGQPYGADIRWNVRDMQATYGEDHTVWLEREMVEMGSPSAGGADAQTVGFGSSIPNSFRAPNLGNPQYDFAKNDAPLATVATVADANSGTGIGTDGQNIWIADIKRWAIRSDAAKAAGLTYYSPGGSDTRHRSKHGYAADAAIHKTVLQGITGIIPFASATERKIKQDIAANAIVATVKFAGSAAAVDFVSGNEGGQFSVVLSGQNFVIRRSSTGTLTESYLPMTLRVRLANSTGAAHTSIVDVFVGQASTQAVPRMHSIASPGIAFCGKKANGLTDGKVLSGVFWLSANTAAASVIYLSGNSSITITSGGGIQFNFFNSSGTQILYWRTNAGFIPNNTNVWISFKFNLATGTVQVVVNKANSDVTGVVLGTPIVTNDNIVFNNKPLTFLNGGLPTGEYNGQNALNGRFGFLWLSSDDLDCSVAANLRQFYNLDGTPVARAYKSTTAGCTTSIEVQGGPGDLTWGSINATDPNIVLPTINVPTVMSLI